MAFALAGGGVALLPEWLARDALDAGKTGPGFTGIYLCAAGHLCGLSRCPAYVSEGAHVYRFYAHQRELIVHHL